MTEKYTVKKIIKDAVNEGKKEAMQHEDAINRMVEQTTVKVLDMLFASMKDVNYMPHHPHLIASITSSYVSTATARMYFASRGRVEPKEFIDDFMSKFVEMVVIGLDNSIEDIIERAKRRSGYEGNQ